MEWDWRLIARMAVTVMLCAAALGFIIINFMYRIPMTAYAEWVIKIAGAAIGELLLIEIPVIAWRKYRAKRRMF
jgi:hypothetical protein